MLIMNLTILHMTNPDKRMDPWREATNIILC